VYLLHAMNILNVILLENENVVLFESANLYDYQIMNECIEMCDFAKEHKPLSIIEKIQITEPAMIDYYVKNYMQYFGINHVRGGSYMTITPEQYEILKTEFKHLDTVKLFENLKYFVRDGNKYTIDRNVIESIQWLSDTVKLKSTITQYENRYTRILQKSIDLVFNDDIYTKYNELLLYLIALHEKIPKVKKYIEYLYHAANPSEIFNKFINSEYRVSENDIQIATKLCEYFEYAAYCIINKCDELEFDINNESIYTSEDSL
jgi:hypothetical protein